MKAHVTWQCISKLRANGIGGFSQVTYAGTGLLTNPVGQYQQARCVGMMRRRVTQKNGFALTTHQ